MANVIELPNEILSKIVDELDTHSKIYLKATCKTFSELTHVVPLKKFKLYDNTTINKFRTLHEFTDYIYTELLDSIWSEKRYFLFRSDKTVIAFHKKRRGNKNTFSVHIDIDGVTKMRFFYESRYRTIRCSKCCWEDVGIPQMFYVVAIRFLMKVYKFRKVRHSFDEKYVPDILTKMLGKNYDGMLIKEMIMDDFVVR